MHVKHDDKKAEFFCLTEETQSASWGRPINLIFALEKKIFFRKNNNLCSFKGNCGPAQQFANTVVKRDVLLLGKEITWSIIIYFFSMPGMKTFGLELHPGSVNAPVITQILDHSAFSNNMCTEAIINLSYNYRNYFLL